MTTKISIPCEVGGKIIQTDFFIGKPLQTENKIEDPIRYQADWLYKKKGGTIPAEIKDAINALCNYSLKTGRPIEELADLAFNKIETKQEKQISVSPTSINAPSPKQIEKGQKR